MKNGLFLFIFSLCYISAFTQEKKSLNIARTSTAPKIDGILDDVAWKQAQEAKDFIQFSPQMGIKETPETRTVVKITYDDDAIYVGAYLYDNPKNIMRQLTSRDNFGESDFFGFILNPNNDGQNDTEFFVFSSGTQADAINSPGIGEDFGWNAVWDSAVKIVDDGWIVEMKIPYRNLRFSNQETPTWGMQIHRHIHRDRSQYTWNPIDVTKGNAGIYNGELKGLENLNPPTRLTFYPFISGIVNSYDGETETQFNAGMDLKYGITENFTLDATLIPDFSQAGFDQVELNLGPFEQTFSEQRQFFTEGVDLFTKGNLFFSRRVGSGPTGAVSLNADEEVQDFPENVKVINAIKVSGRTKKGLGVGVFNAVTGKTNAKIRNTNTNSTRNEFVEPLANYNIFVIDQQFNQNSSVSLINTNVTRNGHFRDANVTGLLANLTTKKNTYNLVTELKMSHLNLQTEDETGYSYKVEFAKVFGNWQYWFGHEYADDVYNINDLGLQFRNNFSNFGVEGSYRTFEPTGIFNNYNFNAFIDYSRLANPNTYTGNQIAVSFSGQLKKLDGFGGNVNFEAGKQYDYFEPREEGRYFIYENVLNGGIWFSSNYNKKFAIDINLSGTTTFEKDRETNAIGLSISPRIRLSEKVMIIYSFDYEKTNGDRGYADNTPNAIIFGNRDRKTMINSVTGSYNFNPFHSLNLTFRNYWSTVLYDDNIYLLQDNGRLQETNVTFSDAGLDDPNINFSTWNLDLSYSWQFAPGSFLTALYRNQLFNYDTEAELNFTNNFDRLLTQPIQNSFSLKIQYFIDYNNIKKVFRKKTYS
ncbi:DUF5916 domain-containing protein [Bizionia myxarmorum]|uniref:Carbohydrate binding family 9 domain-containing protein n=1 Tax=Bizionia myxarmorum TaxID=291186 RepID=A0A5D0R5R6_9FLAO|nr:DUF5916 domain-containing protein [Bizionia myxarmorum]TYB76201.1 carbohydrate binding family 9 domain-containing protein [Bizionia myxarmorum]